MKQQEELLKIAKLWIHSNRIEEQFKIECSLAGIEKLPFEWKLWKLNSQMPKIFGKSLSNAIVLLASIAFGLAFYVLAHCFCMDNAFVLAFAALVFSGVSSLGLAIFVKFLEKKTFQIDFIILKCDSFNYTKGN